jgi:hypothetical protein
MHFQMRVLFLGENWHGSDSLGLARAIRRDGAALEMVSINDHLPNLGESFSGGFPYRLLELIGGFGLQHKWMYDEMSLSLRVRNAGFELLIENDTPSAGYRLNDGSVHLVGMKPVTTPGN